MDLHAIEKYQMKLPGASAFHDKQTLLKFSMSEYEMRQKEYRNLGNEVPFKSYLPILGNTSIGSISLYLKMLFLFATEGYLLLLWKTSTK
jgi:hypothetical protein